MITTARVDKFNVLVDAVHHLEDAKQNMITHWHGGNSYMAIKGVVSVQMLLEEEVRRIDPDNTRRS